MPPDPVSNFMRFQISSNLNYRQNAIQSLNLSLCQKKLLVCGEKQETLDIFNLENRTLDCEVKINIASTGCVNPLFFLTNCNVLYGASKRHLDTNQFPIMQFDLFKHEYTNFFVQHKFKINSIVHVPNTVNFLSSDCGGNIFKWDIRTKEPVGTINLKNEKDFPKDGKAGHVNTLLAADPTGQIVAVVSQKALFMFDLNKMGSSSFSSKGDMYSFTTDMKDLKFSQSGNLITTVDQHGHVYTVDSFELKNSKDDFEIPSVCAPLINDKLPNNMDELMPIYEGQDISADCDYFMDERYLVYGGNCGLLYLRDINEKKSITALHPGPQKRTKINKIKYGNSNLILTAGEDLSLWEANEQQPL